MFELNHDVDVSFPQCCHVDFVTSLVVSRLHRYYAEVLGLLVPDFSIFFFLALFFLFRPTDPKSGNAFDSKRKKG